MEYLQLAAALIVALLFIALLVMAFGPREPIDETITFDPNDIGKDLDAYLLKNEALINNLKPGAEKEVIWFNPKKKHKTKLAIVYLHGFAASKEEIRPLPDIVAKALGANLYYSRSNGHGRDGAAMAEPSANDWFNDTAEALAIGRRLGEQVLIICTSTGGTLASWAATKPSLMDSVAGIVFISPNFAIKGATSVLLTLGGARSWIPPLFGKQKIGNPTNAGHAKWWTTTYPIVAVLPLGALVKFIQRLSFNKTETPALFVFHINDSVVRPLAIREIALEWGKDTRATSQIIEVRKSRDVDKHVIAGRIFSPNNTKPLANKIISWIEKL